MPFTRIVEIEKAMDAAMQAAVNGAFTAWVQGGGTEMFSRTAMRTDATGAGMLVRLSICPAPVADDESDEEL